MNSRELVKSIINFKGAPRIPVNLWIDIVDYDKNKGRETVDRIREIVKAIPRDFFLIKYDPPKGWKPSREYDNGDHEDEWGVIWNYHAYPISHPLSDWDKMDDYVFPDPYSPGRLDRIKNLVENTDKYIVCWLEYTLFERMWALRGFDKLMMDPYLEYEKFDKLRHEIMKFNIGMAEQAIKAGVDAIGVSDDWGSQSMNLISPDQWRGEYKPYYKQILDMANAAGKHTWWHSCGRVIELIPDMIGMGLDVLNPVQPQAMSIEELGKRFRGKLCFWGGVDVQRTLPLGTPEDVKREVRYLIETLGTEDGGYIGGTSHSILSDTPLENISALVEAFEEYNTLRRS